MIKKLQRKMVIIMMISVCLVLSAIMIAINVVNYSRIAKDADEIINIIGSNSGRFPKPDMFKPMGNNEFRDRDKHLNDFNINVETPYETRYFTVKLSDDNSVEYVDTGNVAAIDSSKAIEYANTVLDSNKTKGYIKQYRYNYIEETNMLVFVDCNKQLGTATSFLKASIIISLLGILAVFGLVIIFSNRVVEPAKLAYDKQRRFITDSSHEIKTPLAVISANTEVIEMLNGESEWTRSIRKQVDRLAELNSSLTELARLEEVNKKVNMEQVNLSQLLIEVVKPFNAMLEQNEKELLMDIDENVQYVCEKSEIKQLIGIYMDNASKYSKTFVKISLKKPNSKIKLIVENDTAGIEKGKQEKVFERFYRMDEARNNEVQGFGIGLSIAKSIVDKHNGKVNAVSDDGNIFRITTTLN